MPRVAARVELDRRIEDELRRRIRASSTPQAQVLRARIILSAAEALSNQEIATAVGVTANTVGKWRTRYLLFGLKGLTNWGAGGRPRKHGPEVYQKLRQLLRQPPPDGKERWTIDDLSRRLEVPRSTVHEMLVRGRFARSRQLPRRR